MLSKEIYLAIFRKSVRQLDEKLLKQIQIEAAVVEVLNCVVIKLYKKSWANPGTDPLTAKSRIFFSIWADDSSIVEQKIFYNIHAFKLRQLMGYAIESRKFANSFRASFKKHIGQWPNVSVEYGPFTLMGGSLKIEQNSFRDEKCNSVINL